MFVRTTGRMPRSVMTFLAVWVVSTAAWATDIYVTPTGSDPAGCVAHPNPGAPYLTIQKAVDCASAGDVIHVAAGIYTEQVEVAKDVTVQGAGAGTTTIASPAVLALSFLVGVNPNKPVVFVHDTGAAVVRDLTIDGLGNGVSNYRFLGIAFFNAGGKALGLHVTRIRDTPLSGGQHGVGVYSFNTTSGPYALEIGNCTIDDFQKNAMALSGDGMTVDVHDCIATGAGPISSQAQNGIQVSFGAGGNVTDCTISNLSYTPATFVASGLITSSGTNVSAAGLDITAVQAPVSWYDTNGSMDDLSTTGGADFGPIFIYNSSLSKARSTNSSRRPIAPLREESTDKASAPQLDAALTVSVSNACLTGINAAGTVGVYAASDGGPLATTVTNCILANWDYGLVADGVATSLTAHTNSITGNTSAGYDNSLSGSAQNAEANWWGSASGPSGDGPGTGNAITGGSVDFTPWRTNGIDAAPACGFQPADNTVTPGAPGSCLSIANTCVTVPFVVNRVDATAMRAFSVKFQLSSELQLCSGVASITQGTYLSSVPLSTTSFQVLDNGGGSYTVDCAILGLPCGQTAASGTLFNVAVKRTVASGTGTVTPMFVTMRNCSNATIPGAPGSPLSITIDTTAPAAIALSALQDKTSNGSDGRTFIDVSVPAVGATDVVRVYRKGYGNYPEYDDAPGAGAVPAQPLTEAAALGSGWTLAFSLAGPAGTTVAHEPPGRDFWYFVAFVQDACGNVGGATTMTSGTFDYHLGDVTNGITAGAGDNLVGTVDMSLLGSNYGAVLAANDPVNYLDVGPTTDFSVDARPTTDNRVQFEDLIMFAINYGQVSKSIAHPTPAQKDELLVLVPQEATPGATLVAHLWMRGTGRIQGLSTRLTWNAAAVEPVGADTGLLLHDLAGGAFTPEPGTVDVAVFGVRDLGLAGEGDLATVRFRVIGSGDPGIGISAIDARDAANHKVEIGVGAGNGTPEGALPRVTALLANVPNPFNPTTKIPFTLAVAGPVEVTIYTVNGRRVRTLLQGNRDAGLHEAAWNGTDDAGTRVASGTYYARLSTRDGTLSRPLVLIK